jgi:RNA polymerase sigma factor (TIGR02999 family)
MAAPSDMVTQLLLDWSEGDHEALDQLVPLVYDELRRIAHRHLHAERPDHTLTTTALVHEAYFKLVDQNRVQWKNRAQFFALSSQAMRRILLMYARTRNRQKRGGGQQPLPLDEALMLSETRAEVLIDLDEALTRLEALDERMVRLVECRYFGGLTIEETAEALDVSAATVKREWRAARAWLHDALREQA